MATPDDEAPRARAAAPKKRETPWSVFIVAGVFFAIGLWLYLDVRREVKENEARKARPPATATAKPKILGLDVIPQLSESNEAKVSTAPSAPASSASPSSPSASTSVSPHAAPLPSGVAPK